MFQISSLSALLIGSVYIVHMKNVMWGVKNQGLISFAQKFGKWYLFQSYSPESSLFFSKVAYALKNEKLWKNLCEVLKIRVLNFSTEHLGNGCRWQTIHPKMLEKIFGYSFLILFGFCGFVRKFCWSFWTLYKEPKVYFASYLYNGEQCLSFTFLLVKVNISHPVCQKQ